MGVKEKVTPLPITAYSVVSNCGLGKNVLYKKLVSSKTELTQSSLIELNFPAFVGEVNNSLLPNLDERDEQWASRNTRIALAAMNHDEDNLKAAISLAVKRYGEDRVGMILGTSTSGIYETENAYIHLENEGKVPENYNFSKQHLWISTARYLHKKLKLRGPCYVISTACSSSSKSIAAAQRLICSNICDAVITGGVDSLCRMTLNGFNSLNLISPFPCTPLDQNRCGISIGEGAGLILLEKSRPEFSQNTHLLGCGESSDAYHMTAPHPEGKGAEISMRNALNQARLTANEIDYINLHATGTLKNDESELIAVDKVLGDNARCSGTKGLTGHTLGAAGGIEAIITLLALEHGFYPGTCGLSQLDSNVNCNVVKQSELNVPINIAMSNNYGFGGNNSSLIFGRLDE